MKVKTWVVSAGLMTFAIVATAHKGAAQSYISGARIDTALTLDRGGTLSVSVFSGRVNVSGASGNQVRIRGAVRSGDTEIRARSSSISVSPDPEGPSSGSAEYDITVPTGTRVVLEGFSAPLTVRGVNGEAKIESQSGDVTVSGATGKVTIESVSGDIDVKDVEGSVQAESVNGRVSLSGISGDIDGESISGNFIMTRIGSKSVRIETVDGSIRYSGTFDPAGNYVFKSHAGTLTLGLPRDAGATVTLQTFSGNVDSDFPVTMEAGTSRMGHESKFEFRVGDGRTRIIAETFSGDIRIQRSTNSDTRER